jgi:glyceraldehyde 3-phosphate dehydrogenase
MWKSGGPLARRFCCIIKGLIYLKTMAKQVKVGINGFGRIGRAFFKIAQGREDIEVVAINDLGSVENLAYLLRYDSAYGRANFTVEARVQEGKNALVVNGKEIPVVQVKDPASIPWGKLDAEVIIESTGFFEKYQDARAHLLGGAKRVVITAPAKDEPLQDIGTGTILMGVNNDKLKTCVVTSNGSCTTNASSPLLAILHEGLGVEKAILNTVHAYTATQAIVDSPAKGSDMRRGRAAAHNIVPNSTGAAIAVTKALTDLSGKFDGIAVRVPVITGSIVDITFVASRDTTVEEVNQVLVNAAHAPRWKNIFAATNEQLVSTDIVGLPYASIAQLDMTRVVAGNLVKVLAWYDNEMGYAHMLAQHVVETGSFV